jgi:hypothetical protein
MGDNQGDDISNETSDNEEVPNTAFKRAVLSTVILWRKAKTARKLYGMILPPQHLQ